MACKKWSRRLRWSSQYIPSSKWPKYKTMHPRLTDPDPFNLPPEHRHLNVDMASPDGLLLCCGTIVEMMIYNSISSELCWQFWQILAGWITFFLGCRRPNPSNHWTWAEDHQTRIVACGPISLRRAWPIRTTTWRRFSQGPGRNVCQMAWLKGELEGKICLFLDGNWEICLFFGWKLGNLFFWWKLGFFSYYVFMDPILANSWDWRNRGNMGSKHEMWTWCIEPWSWGMWI